MDRTKRLAGDVLDRDNVENPYENTRDNNHLSQSWVDRDELKKKQKRDHKSGEDERALMAQRWVDPPDEEMESSVDYQDQPDSQKLDELEEHLKGLYVDQTPWSQHVGGEPVCIEIVSDGSDHDFDETGFAPITVCGEETWSESEIDEEDAHDGQLIIANTDIDAVFDLEKHSTKEPHIFLPEGHDQLPNQPRTAQKFIAIDYSTEPVVHRPQRPYNTSRDDEFLSIGCIKEIPTFRGFMERELWITEVLIEQMVANHRATRRARKEQKDDHEVQASANLLTIHADERHSKSKSSSQSSNSDLYFVVMVGELDPKFEVLLGDILILHPGHMYRGRQFPTGLVHVISGIDDLRRYPPMGGDLVLQLGSFDGLPSEATESSWDPLGPNLLRSFVEVRNARPKLSSLTIQGKLLGYIFGYNRHGCVPSLTVDGLDGPSYVREQPFGTVCYFQPRAGDLILLPEVWEGNYNHMTNFRRSMIRWYRGPGSDELITDGAMLIRHCVDREGAINGWGYVELFMRSGTDWTFWGRDKLCPVPRVRSEKFRAAYYSLDR